MSPTNKQLNLIENIELAIDVKFTGETIQEASQFISKHLKKYKEHQEIIFGIIHNTNNY